jgi:PAS domain S-box-containing protein
MRPQPPAVVSIAADHQGASAMLDAFIQASPLAIIAIDLNGTVRHWNRAADEIFGWTAGDAVGRPIPIAPPQAEVQYRGFRKRVLTGDILVGEEIRGQRRDGSLVDLRISLAPLRDMSGEVTGLVAFLEDVPDQPLTEEMRRLYPAANTHADAPAELARRAGTRFDSRIGGRCCSTVDLPS